jgi:hypothetical protein
MFKEELLKQVSEACACRSSFCCLSFELAFAYSHAQTERTETQDMTPRRTLFQFGSPEASSRNFVR